MRSLFWFKGTKVDNTSGFLRIDRFLLIYLPDIPGIQSDRYAEKNVPTRPWKK